MEMREKVARKLLAISDPYVEWETRPDTEKAQWLKDAGPILSLFAEDRRELVERAANMIDTIVGTVPMAIKKKWPVVYKHAGEFAREHRTPTGDAALAKEGVGG